MLPGGYAVVKELSNHAGSTVYIARKAGTAETVIVKEIAKFKSPYWYREWEALSRIKHPNIVRLLASIETDTHVYLVQEYCAQGSLAEHVQLRAKAAKAHWIASKNAALVGHECTREAVEEEPLRSKDITRRIAHLTTKQGLATAAHRLQAEVTGAITTSSSTPSSNPTNQVSSLFKRGPITHLPTVGEEDGPKALSLNSPIRRTASSDLLKLALTSHTPEMIVSTGLGEQEARRYFAEIISALLLLHNNGFTHSDMKLSNAVLDSRNVIKLVDFGLAKDWQTRVLSSVSQQIAGQGEYGGTLEYMPPEKLDELGDTPSTSSLRSTVHSSSVSSRISGFKVVGAGIDEMAADMWACGIILYTLLTGTKPWTRAALSDRRFKYYYQRNVFRDNAWHTLAPSTQKLILGLLCVDIERRFTALLAARHIHEHWGDIRVIEYGPRDASVVATTNWSYIRHSLWDMVWHAASPWLKWALAPFTVWLWIALQWLLKPFATGFG